jgi:CheY-like chemotaxis protein
LNVLSNAIDAAKNGGKHVWLQVSSDAEHLCIRVEDDGPGLAHELEGRAFEPFATTKPYGQGTGLGLAITRQIMQDHRGSARLLPRAEGGARAELVIPKLVTGAHQVLVLDPDPAVGRAVAHDLRRAGFTVAACGSLGQAEDSSIKAPSLIVSETRLRDAEGSELLRQLRERFPAARVLILTGDPARYELAGVAGVMNKPWNREDLIAEVRRLCVQGELDEQRVASSSQVTIRPSG